MSLPKISIGLGILLIILSLIDLIRHSFHYSVLTEYGQGFVWGKCIVLIIGLLLLAYGWRKNRTNENV